MEPGAGPIWLTRGQPAALARVAAMVVGPTPHAILLVGPAAVGKTTLAEDLAAGLLCLAPDPADRPCRACRGCRLVASGNHPDVHRLVPEGSAGQVVIGGSREPGAPRGVRDLVRELGFLPVEGGPRVAIVEGAAQMNEEAQHSLLKTLEEPPAGVTIVLCADREDPLLPTVRSRCARIRLGPLGVRDIESLLSETGSVDPVDAARFARLAEGRPGLAMAYARAPGAAAIRDEIARGLVDLLAAGRARRLTAIRELLGRAKDLAESLAGPPPPPPAKGRRRSAAPDDAPVGPDEATSTTRDSPAERRRAARQLLAIWREVARDLAVIAAGVGGRRAVHDVALLEDLEVAAASLQVGAGAAFLVRLDEVSELVAGNVSPELALDVLVLAWPHSERAAA